MSSWRRWTSSRWRSQAASRSNSSRNSDFWIRPSALTGSNDQIVDRIGEYRDAGAEWVNLALRAPFDVESVDRFAAEVLPAFR